METLKNIRIKKIAVLRALQLGDLLTTVPALKVLRERFPRAEITLIGLPWASAFARRYHRIIDEFIEFPGFLGLPEQPFQPKSFSSFLSKIQNKKFELAIQMQGAGTITNGMMEMFGARVLAGFYDEDSHKPNERYFLKYDITENETKRYLRLMEVLGAKIEEAKTEFPVFGEEQESAEKLLRKYNLKKNDFVCLHAGSREEARRWQADKFVETANFIASKGYKIVFTGTEKERHYVNKIVQKTDAAAVNLSGKTNLGEAAAILKQSALLVTNDTGMVHVASAAGVQSIIIYNKEKSNIERWAPLNRENRTIITPKKAKRIDEVLKKIDEQLREKTLQGANKNYEHARAI